MLFDLFACFDFGENKVKSKNPFKDLEPYKKMMFAHQESISDDAYLISLHKRHDDNVPVHEDNKYHVRILGYCFARTDNKYLKDRARLSANRIAQIYDDHGPDFVKIVKGSFTILLYDKNKKELLIFTDALNVRPLYYIKKSSQLFISSSLAVMSKVLSGEQTEVVINYPALIEYQIFGYILNDDSFLRDVLVVPPGVILKFNKAGLNIKPYWNSFEVFDKIEVEHPNEQVAAEKLETVLKKNLDMHLFDPDRTALALTGGLNSRTNLALLENKSKDFLFYTYGNEESFDVSISKKISKMLKLRLKPIFFDESFQKGLQKNSDLALGLGDGMAEMKHVYALFAYREVAKSYDYILTGFFGNELLTPPQLPNFVINKEMKELLDAPDTEQALNSLLNNVNLKGIGKEIVLEHRDEIIKRILANPYIVNKEAPAKKYFLFLLMVATRKIFMKDVKIEKSFVENLHPFLDIEYIELLLKTPFSWIHTWTNEGISKSSWKADKLYAYLMSRNKPRLNNILSTRGYTPKYLLKSRFSPLMKLEYFYNRKKINQEDYYGYKDQVQDYINKSITINSGSKLIDNQNDKERNTNDQHERCRTLQFWLAKNNLS